MLLDVPEHVISKLGEEWLFDKILVVLLQQFLGGLLGLHGAEFVSFLFKSTDDVTNDTAL